MKLFVLATAVLAAGVSSRSVISNTSTTTDFQAIRDTYEGAMMTAFSGEQANAMKETISHIAQDMFDNFSNPDVLRAIANDFLAMVPDDVHEGAIGKEDQLLEKRGDDDDDDDIDIDLTVKDLTDDRFFGTWMAQCTVWWNMWNCCGTCPMGS